jgi:alpha-mannosidase
VGTGDVTHAALDRLRSAADAVWGGWLPERWEKRAGPGPSEVAMRRTQYSDVPAGTFVGLGLAPGAVVEVETELAIPQVVHGVDISGDSVELTLHSLFPMEVRGDGRLVFEDDLPPVAAGPAAFVVVDSYDPARPPRLTIKVTCPDAQIDANWCHIHLTTPRLRRRFFALDTAWARLYAADAVAETDEERKAVGSAAALVPADMADSDLDAMAAALAPVRDKVEALRVCLVGHSHIDLAWLWTWADTRRVIVRDVRSVLGLMDEFPQMRFTHSQPATYAALREDAPDLFDAVADRVAEGRWEPATMQWAEGDLNLATGEAQARQLLEGVRWTRDALGAAPSVFLAPDTFGHAGNIPQLARSAGAVAYYHHRANPGAPWAGEADKSWPAWWWEGDDGTRLLALWTPTYNSAEVTPSAVARAAVERGVKAGLPAALHFFGVGDHGGGPTRQSLRNITAMQGLGGLPAATCSTLRDYADLVIGSGARLPVHRGETRTVFEGCYTTHADTKRWNRRGEDALIGAEALVAVAGVGGHAEPLRDAWRILLLHQFHDILDGSAIAEAYRDQAEAMGPVLRAAEAATDEALRVLTAGAAPAGWAAVTNPVAVERVDPVVLPVDAPVGATEVLVEDTGGATHVGQVVDGGVLVVARVGPLATEAFGGVRPADLAKPVQVTRRPATAREGVEFWQVRTDLFDVELRSDCGVVTSLVDRRTGNNLVARGRRVPSDYTDDARPDLALGVLQLVEEHPHVMSSWQHLEVFRETSLLRGASTSLVEEGPLRAVIESRLEFGSSVAVRRWTFWKSLDRIDLAVDVDWQEPGGPDIGVPNLKVAFSAAVEDPEAWFETPFGAARRRADGQQVPALRWAALCGRGTPTGLAVLNDGVHGHDALGPRLRANIVRTAYAPDERSDQGPMTARFSLRHFAGDWREAGLTAQAMAWNQPLLATVIDAAPQHDGRRLRPRVIGTDGVVVTTVKRSYQDDGLVVRLAEVTGRARSVVLEGLPDGPVWEATVVEDKLRRLPAEDPLSLAFEPFQVRTLVIEDGP